MSNAATAIDLEPSHTTYACQVIGVKPLNVNTFQVELQSPAGTTLSYQAGQYLQLELDVNGNGEPQPLFYSIAKSFDPAQPRRLQLTIQNGSDFAAKILKCLSQHSDNNEVVSVTLAMGQAYLQSDLALPHLLVAAGSGIAKIKCITEEILRQKSDANVSVYWSNKCVEDFYLLDEFRGWVGRYENLNFTPILEAVEAGWQGRSGYLYEVIETDFESLDGFQAYLCGSPQMVYGTIDQLEVRGLKEGNCYSDVFEFAPRN